MEVEGGGYERTTTTKRPTYGHVVGVRVTAIKLDHVNFPLSKGVGIKLQVELTAWVLGTGQAAKVLIDTKLQPSGMHLSMRENGAINIQRMEKTNVQRMEKLNIQRMEKDSILRMEKVSMHLIQRMEKTNIQRMEKLSIQRMETTYREWRKSTSRKRRKSTHTEWRKTTNREWKKSTHRQW